MLPARREPHMCRTKYSEPKSLSWQWNVCVEKQGNNDSMGKKPVRAERVAGGGGGCVLPGEAGGGKTQVALTERLQGRLGRLAVLLDHVGCLWVPSLSNVEFQDWKWMLISVCESKTWLSETASAVALILWLECMLFPVGCLKALGSFKSNQFLGLRSTAEASSSSLPCSLRDILSTL